MQIQAVKGKVASMKKTEKVVSIVANTSDNTASGWGRVDGKQSTQRYVSVTIEHGTATSMLCIVRTKQLCILRESYFVRVFKYILAIFIL